MLSNQAMEICYNVQVTVDEKNKLILDYEVTNENDDSSHLSEMSERAKQILEVDKLEVLADANYYEAEEIKKCVDNGITPYIPERNNEVRKDIDPSFYRSKFGYDVKNYDQNLLAKFLGEDFKLLEYFEHTYYMPSGEPRPYIYALFQKT